MKDYSMIVSTINNYNNIADMKNKFNNLLRNYQNYELEEFKQEILNEENKHIKKCKETESNCSYLQRYKYAISRIDIIIANNISNYQKQSININNSTINSNNTHQHKSNNIDNLPIKKNIYSKYWWGLVVPLIVGILIWYLTK